MPPLRLDPDVAASIQPASLAAYRRAGLAFARWLQEHGLRPHGAEEWDDLLVEWKNMASVSKSHFTGAVASVEYFFAHFRGKLSWSHHVLKGMSIRHPTRHTVPMIFKYACYFAAHFAARGFSRLGVGVCTQQFKGLRPSEMLGVRACDVLLPEHSAFEGCCNTVVNLGAKTGTKAKRPQAVIIPGSSPITELLRRVKSICVLPDERLFPYTLAKYNSLIKAVSKESGLEDVGWTAHSPRAGFASESRAQGKSFVEIREEGRWVADSSLRIYLDVVATAQIEAESKATHIKADAEAARARVLDFLCLQVLRESC